MCTSEDTKDMYLAFFLFDKKTGMNSQQDEVEVMTEANIIVGLSNCIVGILMIVLCIPLKKGIVKMNMLYGIRFEKSFESEEYWHKINEYGAKRFIFWSLPLLALGICAFLIPFDTEILILIFAFAPLVIILIPTVQSYYYAKNL